MLVVGPQDYRHLLANS